MTKQIQNEKLAAEITSDPRWLSKTTQPKTTKEQEPMTTVVASDEPGDEREDWRQRLHSLQECICELLIRNQELRMALLDSRRLINESDEFVREHRSQSPVLSWNSGASRPCAGSRVLGHERLIITNSDRTVQDTFAAVELRQMFTEVNAKVTVGMEAMSPADPLKRHGLVSEEDFAKKPLRNRLALCEIHAEHAMYHAGQIRPVEIARERCGDVPLERKTAS